MPISVPVTWFYGQLLLFCLVIFQMTLFACKIIRKIILLVEKGILGPPWPPFPPFMPPITSLLLQGRVAAAGKMATDIRQTWRTEILKFFLYARAHMIENIGNYFIKTLVTFRLVTFYTLLTFLSFSANLPKKCLETYSDLLLSTLL